MESVACGNDVSGCVVKGGGLYTWGVNRRAELGHGDLTKRTVGRMVKALRGVYLQQLSFGGEHTVGLSVWGGTVQQTMQSPKLSSSRQSLEMPQSAPHREATHKHEPRRSTPKSITAKGKKGKKKTAGANGSPVRASP